MSSLLPDFPPGPMDIYRKKASFDWKKMKIFIENEDLIKFENNICELLKPHIQDSTNQTLESQRRTVNKITVAACALFSNVEEKTPENANKNRLIMRTLINLNPSGALKSFVQRFLYGGVIDIFANERHTHIVEKVKRGEIFGCYCLTEIKHGSNIQKLETRATYDPSNEEFILHTPDFGSAKCWSGCLGQTASYAVVYAQLYLNGQHYGLHMFLVPIRDTKTLMAFPGVTVGDMGEKTGFHGTDNGFLMFENYRIKRENLLSNHITVTPEGNYNFLKSTNPMIAALSVLSIGRMNIIHGAEAVGTKGIIIALRYAAIRRQFACKENEEEIPILEYQTHQMRLLPYLAGSYIIRFSTQYLYEVSHLTVTKENLEEITDTDLHLIRELHAISAGGKCVSSWLFRDALQECREACGGHGYLKAAELGDLRNDNDANCTYEGENHVLIQSTSSYLIKCWSDIQKGRKVETPMKSIWFLADLPNILKLKFNASNKQQVCQPEVIMEAHRWLICYLLQETTSKLEKQGVKVGTFWAKNNTQIYYAKTLAITYIQHFFLQSFLDKVKHAKDVHIHDILMRLFSLYGLWNLEKNLGTLYQGGYLQGPYPTQLIRETILDLCSIIKNDAIALADAAAPPEYFIQSVLGAGDGLVYKRLKSNFFKVPGNFTRPSWWKEVVNWRNPFDSKL